MEADTPLRKLHWFWHPNDEASLKSVDDLMDSYEHSVGKGGQWMLGVAPDNRGLLPDSDVARLKELGVLVRPPFLGVPDPKQKVLEQAGADACAIRIDVDQPE